MTPSEAHNRIRHDLGKYVALQQRWLPADPALDLLRAALKADLLETRRGPAGSVDVVGVWAGLADARASSSDPAVDAISRLVGAIGLRLDPLRDGTADAAAIASLRADAGEIARLCRSLGR